MFEYKQVTLAEMVLLLINSTILMSYFVDMK